MISRSNPLEIDEVRPGDGFDGREYAENHRAIARNAGGEAYLSPSAETLLRDRPVEQSFGLAGSLRACFGIHL